MVSGAPDEFEQLLQEQPLFHGRDMGAAMAATKSWAVDEEVLRWILQTLKPGARTLETGCGYSTIAFALQNGRHTVVSPFTEEHQLIADWCRAHQVPVDHIEFIASDSQSVLPQLPLDPLDMVLIDGDHAIPAPFIDWYYTADRVVRGGRVVVDDTQLRSGLMLRDFLKSETTRWRLEREFDRTVVFRRISDERVAKGLGWGDQPFCYPPAYDRARRKAKHLLSLPPRAVRRARRIVSGRAKS